MNTSKQARMPKIVGPLVIGPLCQWRLWMGLGWSDIVQNYRRTMFGPFWISLNLVIFAASMTLVYGALFAVPPGEYAGYVVCGMIAWLWVSGLLAEAGNTFIIYAPYIRSMPFDKSIFIWATVFKLLITLAHNMIIYAILVAVGLINLTFYSLLIIPAVGVLFLLSIPFTAIVSILFARFRDIPRLISGTIIIILMMTPIFWQPHMMTGWRQAFVYLNPVYYLIEFIRLPLLGFPITPLIATVVLSMTVFLWVLGGLIYRRYHSYVVFWV